ncbi:hypothetical protein EFO10_02285 [Lactococcus cremoris]|nr:hypothetical protein [Lactococcus cremoris]
MLKTHFKQLLYSYDKLWKQKENRLTNIIVIICVSIVIERLIDVFSINNLFIILFLFILIFIISAAIQLLYLKIKSILSV